METREYQDNQEEQEKKGYQNYKINKDFIENWISNSKYKDIKEYFDIMFMDGFVVLHISEHASEYFEYFTKKNKLICIEASIFDFRSAIDENESMPRLVYFVDLYYANNAQVNNLLRIIEEIYFFEVYLKKFG
jgi:hypothetical protein